MSLGRDPERLLAVLSLRNFVAVALERQRDELEDVGVVVGDQDERSDRHAATFFGCALPDRAPGRASSSRGRMRLDLDRSVAAR